MEICFCFYFEVTDEDSQLQETTGHMTLLLWDCRDTETVILDHINKTDLTGLGLYRPHREESRSDRAGYYPSCVRRS